MGLTPKMFFNHEGILLMIDFHAAWLYSTLLLLPEALWLRTVSEITQYVNVFV
jgi:hypothetical protein